MPRIDSQIINDCLSKLCKKNILHKKDSSLIVYDLDFLNQRIQELTQSFPSHSIHAIAIKANPLISILKLLKKKGVGLEAASYQELYFGLKLAFSPSNLVYDSPAKAVFEIKKALKKGVRINANSFEELVYINANYGKSKSSIGLRINPEIGAGTINKTSVATSFSKFGVSIESQASTILSAYKQYPWLNSIHYHVGSQGISMEQLIESLKKMFALTQAINIETNNQIKYFDLGGGLPATYNPLDVKPSIQEYALEIKRQVPELFTKKITLITEFGRAIFANSAWAITRVEYVKKLGTKQMLIVHLGADFLLRKAYNSSDWHHEFSVFDSAGNEKRSKEILEYTIAGPLCFSGDIIGEKVKLPKVERGDLLIIHDIGAYTLSMWSRYNSRSMPKVVSIEGENVQILKKRESNKKVFEFWKS